MTVEMNGPLNRVNGSSNASVPPSVVSSSEQSVSSLPNAFIQIVATKKKEKKKGLKY